jgi:hypothetical protein
MEFLEFFEFRRERLVDVDGDGMLEHVDPIPKQATPILYASSYNAYGYDPSDVNVFGKGDPRNLQHVYRQRRGRPWNGKSFQIISPGPDGRYGRGGVFDPKHTNKLHRSDRDNVTNFTSGALGN